MNLTLDVLVLDVNGVDPTRHIVANFTSMEGILGRVERIVVDVVVTSITPG